MYGCCWVLVCVCEGVVPSGMLGRIERREGTKGKTGKIRAKGER